MNRPLLWRRPFVAGAFLSDGTPDPSFDEDGIAVAQLWSSAHAGIPEAIAIDPSGRILLAGAHVIRFGEGDFSVTGLVVCFLPNGQLDASFGAPHQTGLKSVGALNTGFYGVNALPDGRILAAGRPGNYYAHVFAARLLANGSLDSSYQAGTDPGIAIPGPDPCRLGENSRGRCGRARFLLFSGRRASHAAGARGPTAGQALRWVEAGCACTRSRPASSTATTRLTWTERGGSWSLARHWKTSPAGNPRMPG